MRIEHPMLTVEGQLTVATVDANGTVRVTASIQGILTRSNAALVLSKDEARWLLERLQAAAAQTGAPASASVDQTTTKKTA